MTICLSNGGVRAGPTPPDSVTRPGMTENYMGGTVERA